jgi:F-type H+-transporting ATPase subunit b
MEEPVTTHETIEVPSHGGGDHGGGPDLLAINKGLALWTWVTFILVCVVLYKVAWKPILESLDQREKDIRKSLEDAEKIRNEMARMENTQKRMIGKAEDAAKQILTEARKGATEAAHVIEEKAREEAQILVENATREIAAAQEKAQDALKQESAEIAVSLASKINGERLDAEKDQEMVERLIREI